MLTQKMVNVETLYATEVEGRRVIYLDSNVWIDLARQRSDVAKRALELALQSRRTGNAVFPVSHASLNELFKQRLTAGAREQAAVMDALSGAICLRAYKHVFDLEVRSVYEYLVGGEPRSRMNERFTEAVCSDADVSLEFPEASISDAFMSLVPRFSVSWIQETLPDDWVASDAEGDELYVQALAAREEGLLAFTNKDGSRNASKLRHLEREYVWERVIGRLPQLVGDSAAMLALVRFNARQTKEMKRGAFLKKIVDVMPSKALSCELHVQKSLDRNLPIRKEDFNDHEQATLAVPCSDAFVTSDGELADLLRKAFGAVRYRAKIIRGLDGLSDLLVHSDGCD